MSLAEKIKRKERRSEVVEVQGVKFRITGKGTLGKSEVFADIRKRKLNMDAAFLAAYVTEAETGEAASYEDWCNSDEDISGPLVAVVMSVAGLDKDDLKRDPNDSSTTENLTSPIGCAESSANKTQSNG